MHFLKNRSWKFTWQTIFTLFKVEAVTLAILNFAFSDVTWCSLVEVYRVLELGHLLPSATERQV